MHVFVSYKHEDVDFAENVMSRLEAGGFQTWADHKIGAGEEWRTAIDLSIKNSFVLIAIMTPEAKASEYVTYEWVFAWGVGIRVIPVMLRRTELHPRLETLQYLDFTDHQARPWGRLLEEVQAASKALLAHTNLRSIVQHLCLPASANCIMFERNLVSHCSYAIACPTICAPRGKSSR